ncbi:hypothetical protein H2203_003853 [Taxawa tesnikishii (nom. ined.)]|nr:hypothetical protein H2203_003853 [Dothideales sp. JES 119]
MATIGEQQKERCMAEMNRLQDIEMELNKIRMELMLPPRMSYIGSIADQTSHEGNFTKYCEKKALEYQLVSDKLERDLRFLKEILQRSKESGGPNLMPTRVRIDAEGMDEHIPLERMSLHN